MKERPTDLRHFSFSVSDSRSYGTRLGCSLRWLFFSPYPVFQPSSILVATHRRCSTYVKERKKERKKEVDESAPRIGGGAATRVAIFSLTSVLWLCSRLSLAEAAERRFVLKGAESLRTTYKTEKRRWLPGERFEETAVRAQ